MPRHREEKDALADSAAKVDGAEVPDHCTGERHLTNSQRAGRALARDLLRSAIHASDGSGETAFARRLEKPRSFVAARLDRSRSLDMTLGDFLGGASTADLANLGKALLALADGRRSGLGLAPASVELADANRAAAEAHFAADKAAFLANDGRFDPSEAKVLRRDLAIVRRAEDEEDAALARVEGSR